MAVSDVAGCIMYEIFFVNFWVIILCPVFSTDAAMVHRCVFMQGYHWLAECIRTFWYLWTD